MSVSSIVPTSSIPSAPSTVGPQFSQLIKPIDPGDLADAQRTYAQLSQSPAPSSSPFAGVLKQIGDALQSGNIGDAKQALTSLQQQISAHRGHHHHRHNSSSQSASSGQRSGASPADRSNGSTVNNSA